MKTLESAHRVLGPCFGSQIIILDWRQAYLIFHRNQVSSPSSFSRVVTIMYFYQASSVFLLFLCHSVHSVSSPTFSSRTRSHVAADEPLHLPTLTLEGNGTLSSSNTSSATPNVSSAADANSSMILQSWIWPLAPFDYREYWSNPYIRVQSYSQHLIPALDRHVLVELFFDAGKWAEERSGTHLDLEATDHSFACAELSDDSKPAFDFVVTLHNSDHEPGLPHFSRSFCRFTFLAAGLIQGSRKGHLMSITPIYGGKQYRRITVQKYTLGTNYHAMPCRFIDS